MVSFFFNFHPYFGEDEPILTNIFQMGWNHQLVEVYVPIEVACYIKGRMNFPNYKANKEFIFSPWVMSEMTNFLLKNAKMVVETPETWGADDEAMF